MKYEYNGPLSGVSLKGHGDVMLAPGATVELPEGHLYTNRLIKRGWLTPAIDPSTLRQAQGERANGSSGRTGERELRANGSSGRPGDHG